MAQPPGVNQRRRLALRLGRSLTAVLSSAGKRN
jgi:hypothetical protein